MRRFASKIILFFLPFVLLSILPLALGIYWGDLRPTSQIIALQEANDGIYSPSGTRESLISYKLQMAFHRRADFLVLGSSRLQPLSEDAITNPDYRFYNASINGLSPIESLAIIKVMAEQDAMPGILFVNLDLGNFNADRVEFRRNSIAISASDLNIEINRMNHSFQDIALAIILNPQGMFEMTVQTYQAPSRHFIGKIAITTGQGYGIDGSNNSGYIYSEDLLVRGLTIHQQDWDNRNKMYEIGSSVDQESLIAISDMIELAKAHNTLIIAVLPPYHPHFYELLQNSQEHSYFELARDAIAMRFENSGMLFYDFTDPTQANIDQHMFFDGWHLGKVGTLQMYLQIVNDRPDILAQYSDAERLNALLENVPSSGGLRD